MENDQKKKTKEEIESDLRTERTIEQLLSNVGAGWTISLNRMRPSWCKGWLETIEASPDEPLDMNYIADTWGGETIRLRFLDGHGRYKGGKDIHMAREPMFHGRELEHPNDKRARMEREERTRDRREHNEGTIRLNAAQPQQDNTVFTMLVDVLKDSNTNSLQTYKDLVAKQQARDPMGIDDIIKFANGLKDLQGVFGGDNDGGAADDSDDKMLGTFVGIMEKAHERDVKREDRKEAARERRAESRRAESRRAESRRAESRRSQAPPSGHPKSNVHHIPNPNRQRQEPPPEAARNADPEADEELALSEELAELEPAEAAEVLGEAFTMMDPEKRQKTMKLLMTLGDVAEAADIVSGDGSIEDLVDEDQADEDQADEDQADEDQADMEAASAGDAGDAV